MDFRKQLDRSRGLVAAYPAAAILVYLVVVSAFFLLLPGFDLWFTGLFYSPDGGFFLTQEPVLQTLRRLNGIIIPLIVVWLVVQLVIKLARPEHPSYVRPNVALFLITTLILGPGIVVNVILKNNWGRPRPHMVEQFGGSEPYVQVWRITDYCARNCSFVSGEASSTIWLMAVVLVAPKHWRVPLAVIVMVYAFLLSLNRVAFGGHFLSDVLISWGLTLLIVLVAWRYMVERPPSWLAADRLEAGLARFGERLQKKSRRA